ncbi:AGE family epimerase/isomerase [Draconibacterium sediminis]|uniref:AGE family epimerase/isomerase n=1 Tax=Draconibacterium sediminis TaxID=1544798 RepID=UPI0026EF2BE8|nr:AGE family epimerase/isomerase [Draconibacterium sediminis]
MKIKLKDKRQQLQLMLPELKNELSQILDFWSTKAVDAEHGGFVGQINSAGEVISGAGKGAVLNTRLLWTFSAAFRNYGEQTYLKMADRAYDYLVHYFWDKENSGLYWECDYLGNPLNTRKQAYVQGFGIYAFSEYYLATGKEESLEYALSLFDLLESKFKDFEFEGYLEALSRNFQPLKDMRLSPKDANFPKSMNTHLHILEPYTNLYKAWPNQHLKERILVLLNLFHNQIIDRETGHFNLFFDMDWTVQSNIVSYGHDIEGAWLLNEAAIETKDVAAIQSVRKSALRLVDITLDEGTDTDGSVWYEKEGDHIDKDRHWWVQAEAMVGLMDAWEICSDERYIQNLTRIWEYIKKNLLDTKNGEWFWSINNGGLPNLKEDKAGFWKCPYHNSRALIELIKRISKLEIKNDRSS